MPFSEPPSLHSHVGRSENRIESESVSSYYTGAVFCQDGVSFYLIIIGQISVQDSGTGLNRQNHQTLPPNSGRFDRVSSI